MRSQAGSAETSRVVVSKIDVNAKFTQQPSRREDVIYQRKVFQMKLVARQKTGGHRRKRRVLSAADSNRTLQGLAAGDLEFIHSLCLPFEYQLTGDEGFYDLKLIIHQNNVSATSGLDPAAFLKLKRPRRIQRDAK